MASIPQVLDALVGVLKEGGVDAVVGRPFSAADVFLWPWQLLADSQARNLPPPLDQSSAERRHQTGTEVHFLVIAGGEGRAAMERLSQAHALLTATPVLQVAGTTVAVAAATLTTAELAALFLAAQVPVTLSSSFTLRFNA